MSPVGYTLQPEPGEDYVGEDGDLADDGAPDADPLRPTPVP
jgi:hypothetical protein